MEEKNPILHVKNLSVSFKTEQGLVTAVDNISYTLHKKEVLGIVGESGSGKTVSSSSIMRLLDSNANVRTSGEIFFEGNNLLTLPKKQMRSILGGDIAMIFQNPMSCLNPFLTIEKQLVETILLHNPMSKKDARDYAVGMLEKVHIPVPAQRIKQYPHHFSGGMKQRVMIAMALCCEPKILICDEPTTALDVTVQAQILDLIEELIDKFDTAVLFITHDMGVIARLCEQVCVMYAGKIVEYASVGSIFKTPVHPYTKGLLQAMPKISETSKEEFLPSIDGSPPDLLHLPQGCAFNPRCAYATEQCYAHAPPQQEFREKNKAARLHTYKCFNPLSNEALQLSKEGLHD